jgi:hypothetical protein
MGNKIQVDSYDAYRDPHNYFVSAGVVGGWPLLAVAIFGLVLMFMGSLKGLMRHNTNLKMLGLFLLCHIPVFMIYHVYLSLGGLADRLYWLIFGYLAVVPSRVGLSEKSDT